MDNSIIVYHNPFERWIWEQGGLLVLSACFLMGCATIWCLEHLFIYYNSWRKKSSNHVVYRPGIFQPFCLGGLSNVQKKIIFFLAICAVIATAYFTM